MNKQLSLEHLINCGCDQSLAATMLPQLNEWLSCLPATECWQIITQKFIKPDYPFALHQLLYKITFSDWDKTQGIAPAWFPIDEQIKSSNIAALMHELHISSYRELHYWSVQNRARFWELMIEKIGIYLRRKYTQIVNLSDVESANWLNGASFNIAESCFQAPKDSVAIAFQPEGGSLSFWTYGELNILTNRVANGLIEAGFEIGDRIAIAMPMTAESVAIYLGIIKAGCTVVSIADSFAANEIATRIRISNAKAIFTQYSISRAGKKLPLYTKVVEANAPKAIVISIDNYFGLQLRQGDSTWENFLSYKEDFDPVPCNSSDYTNILFSSGTTGDPKAIPWTQTTPIKCAVDGYLHQDIHQGDVVAWSTNLGWMMGPWLIFASLINQATIALYYGTPTEREYGQFVQDARVNILGLVPSLVNIWKTTNCMQGLDWSAIKAFSSTGECSNPQDMLFLMSLAGYKPIIEYCGGTEIGGGYITGTVIQPCAPATFTTPALGLDLVILDEDGQLAEQGEAFIIPPSIGLSTELLNKDHHQVYFADTPTLSSTLSPLRRHGDQIERLPNGYFRAQGRVDDTMNLGGIKVSSTEIERILHTVEGISETAAIAISPLDGGPSQLVIYAVLSAMLTEQLEELKSKLQRAIAQNLNPLFKIRAVVIVESLPRTASNKVMRRVLREQYIIDTLRAEATEIL
ncbi:MAG: AMP-binding protein [Crinalium sp.]